jgi:uncharacterized protein involved in exopolysaccharide biosynthesis
VAFGKELETLQSQRDELGRRIAAFNEHEIQLAKLQLQVDLAETNLRSYAERLEQARIDQALELDRISNVNVVQPPSLPQSPSAPRKLLLLGLGLLAACAGSCGVVFLSHQLEDRLYRRDEVETLLGVPVLLSLEPNGNGHSRRRVSEPIAR